MQKANVADTVEAIFQRCERGTLRQEHEDAIKTFIKKGIFFWLEELEAKICANYVSQDS